MQSDISKTSVPIRENLLGINGKVTRVWERYFNLLSSTVDVTVSTNKKQKGFIEGLHVTLKDATSVYISAGNVEIDGFIYTNSATVTFTIGTLLSDIIYYIYVTPPASGLALSVTEFSISTTGPTFSDDLGAQYKADDTTKRYIARYIETDVNSAVAPVYAALVQATIPSIAPVTATTVVIAETPVSTVPTLTVPSVPSVVVTTSVTGP